MKGYVFLDNEMKLHRKDKDYIELIDLKFWIVNAHLIRRSWKFDTEVREVMIQILKDFRDLEVPTHITLMFLKDIGFSLESLKIPNADII